MPQTRPQNEIPKITTLPHLCWNTVLLQVIMIAQNVEWIIPLHFLFNMIVASSQCRTSFMTLPQLTMFAQVADNGCSHCYMGNYHQTNSLNMVVANPQYFNLVDLCFLTTHRLSRCTCWRSGDIHVD